MKYVAEDASPSTRTAKSPVIDPVPGLFDDVEVQKSHLRSLSRDE